MIHEYNHSAICKVFCDAVTKLDKVLFQRLFIASQLIEVHFTIVIGHILG